ncbi:MAG TPA: uroporphyrinogen decarboxylase family protein [Acidobacteriota bacterium]|nr:uroporphyrinogen decarboxylase family protein [Acidobacteriota bacterium]HRR55478.1 uroporphyrinogen decarboxylase family protein [Acidobacteriota bacterium]HRV07752.1 uroporphyrinogen decarboxylase family protein [Acidobacteriota bacterium]
MTQPSATQEQYRQRLARYVTALRNEQPDAVPIRPFVAEFTAKYAGFTCQEVTHDYEKAFEAVCRCARDFDWDAVVPNMVYVWTGLTEALDLKYYGVPGIDVPANVAFQYREPPEEEAFMRADEYDALIDDPTAFLYTTWLPRVSRVVPAAGEPATYRGRVALVKTAWAMGQYFQAFGPQVTRLREECGTAPAIAGILKAPFDILSDKLRGYVGLTMDMLSQPQKVLRACEALAPHLFHVALTTADPNHQAPVGFWMHRGCVPFVSPQQFETHYWPTLKPVIEELWRRGHQVLFYAEGNWDHHLGHFSELPERSIVFHVDKGDLARARRTLGDKFCLSGGISNTILSFGTTDEVLQEAKRVLAEAAKDGAYIADAGAIMQNDTDVENLRILTDFIREHGVYPRGHSFPAETQVVPEPDQARGLKGLTARTSETKVKPGVCTSWEERARERPPGDGDADLFRRVWEDIEGLGYSFIWHCLVSF